ncbi:MAG: hypothetical protein ATN36_00740 [Epulopiscium sp. Nele67-Bin005]|nr:MAG: hypothetical protein ATN36_00740 [Epulopiscium sp. Nele67-Bin005]
MEFLNKLERKFGKFAIPNLMFYLLFGQGVAFILTLLNPYVRTDFMFSWDHIMAGEFWRLITFIFIPSSTSTFWFIIMVFIYYSIGSQLERWWGTFNFNFYYFISVLATIIVCALLGIRGNIATYINQSLFLSFATLVPEATFYLYFIIPVKAKYLVVFYFLLFGVEIWHGGITSFLLIAASLTGYIIFFGIPAIKGQRMKIKAAPAQKAYKEARKNVPKGSAPPIKVAFHKCSTCGKTELDDPELEFRYCSTCNKEYCIDHLGSHEH